MELTKAYFDKQSKIGREYFNKKFGELDRKFATKDDLKNFATKDDLKKFATKDDLKNFATKDDLKKFATKDDLKNFATKDDLKSQTQELKHYADEQTEKLAMIIATSVAEPLDKHLQEVSVAEEVTMSIWKKLSDKSARVK